MRLHEIIDQMQGEGYFEIIDIKGGEVITTLVVIDGGFYEIINGVAISEYVLDVNDLMYDGWQVKLDEKQVDIILDEYTILFSEKLGIDFLIKKIKDGLWLIFDDECERVMYIKVEHLTLDYLNDVTKQVYEFVIKQGV
jgi:hypothetical protein